MAIQCDENYHYKLDSLFFYITQMNYCYCLYFNIKLNYG